MSRLRFLLRPGWLCGVAIMLGFAAVCWTVLAPWQFSRHEQRAQTNAALTAALRAPTLAAMTALPLGGSQPEQLTWHRVQATGTFLTDEQVFVRLRQDSAGRAAVEVLLPFRLTDGTVLLVDRGFWPADALTSGKLPPTAPVSEVTIIGRVQVAQPDPAGRNPVETGGYREVYGIQARSFPGLISTIRPGFVQLTADSPGVLAPIGTPVPDAGPFLSYAWQWITFGTIAVLALGYFIVREVRDPRDELPRPRHRDGFAPAELYDS